MINTLCLGDLNREIKRQQNSPYNRVHSIAGFSSMDPTSVAGLFIIGEVADVRCVIQVSVTSHVDRWSPKIAEVTYLL